MRIYYCDVCWMCTGKNGCGGEIEFAQGTPKYYGMKFCPYCGMKMTQRKPDEKMRSVDAEIARESMSEGAK